MFRKIEKISNVLLSTDGKVQNVEVAYKNTDLKEKPSNFKVKFRIKNTQQQQVTGVTCKRGSNLIPATVHGEMFCSLRKVTFSCLL